MIDHRCIKIIETEEDQPLLQGRAKQCSCHAFHHPSWNWRTRAEKHKSFIESITGAVSRRSRETPRQDHSQRYVSGCGKGKGGPLPTTNKTYMLQGLPSRGSKLLGRIHRTLLHLVLPITTTLDKLTIYPPGKDLFQFDRASAKLTQRNNPSFPSNTSVAATANAKRAF